MFTKKHFTAIAKILSHAERSVESMGAPPYYAGPSFNEGYTEAQYHAEDIVNEITNDFITLFKADNPNFDEKRFREAVGGI